MEENQTLFDEEEDGFMAYYGKANAAEETDDEVDGMFEHHRLVVDKGQSAVRVDKFLSDKLSGSSRNRLQAAIDLGFVKVNGQPTKSSYKVKPFDEVILNLPAPPRTDDIKPENIPLDIVFEDEHLLLVNKPAGMVVHPAYANWEGTLVNALVYHLQNLPTSRNGEGRPGLVHRIDKDTSGLLVIAKTEQAMVHLAKQFFYHSIQRSYTALVWGVPSEEEGTIDVNLGRHPKDRRVTAPFPDGSQGKRAVSHYKVLEHFNLVSLLEFRLETGRTHQIRAHSKYLGHPIFNDVTYGGNKILKGLPSSSYSKYIDNCFKLCPRQALHAKSLGFIHPATEKEMFFEVPLPEDMQLLIEKWRNRI